MVNHNVITVMGRDILLIDDDTDELIIFLDALGQLPDETFTCSYASNTSQAKEVLERHVPDYIFIDFNIPVVNGLDFLAEIKNLPGLQHAQVFLYSNFINEEMNRKARTLGASGCIRKTHTISMLAAELKVIFSEGPHLAYTFFKGK